MTNYQSLLCSNFKIWLFPRHECHVGNSLISFVLFLNFFDFIEKYIKYKKGKNVKIRFIFKFKEIL